MQQILIDKFTIPPEARDEFISRMEFNRSFIKNLPGFIEDAVYMRTDENGNIVYVTIAVWKNESVLKLAKEAVQAEYRKHEFDLEKMFKRLRIIKERASYTKI